MDSTSSQVFSLLTTEPGNLVYRVILAFSIFGALQMTSRQWQDSTNRLARRMASGLGVLLVVQFLLILAALLSWQGVLDGHKALPVLMCGASLLSSLWLVWLWVYPDEDQRADVVFGALSILFFFFIIDGTIWWIKQDPNLFFIGTWDEQAASLIGLVLCLIGLFLLALRQPALWGLGIVSMVFLLLGYLANWLFSSVENDFAGIVRIAELIVYPLLMMLPQRLDMQAVVQETGVRDKQVWKSGQTRTVAVPSLVQALLSRAAETDPYRFYEDFCRAYAQWMIADVCLLALPTNGSNQLNFHVGYDLVANRLIDGFEIQVDRLPLLTNVVRRGRNLRLDANSSALDLKSLAEALGFEQAGNLLTVAVPAKDGVPLISIVLLSPYTKRAWSAQEQQKVLGTTKPMAGIFHMVRRIAQQQEALERYRAISGETRHQYGDIPATDGGGRNGNIALLTSIAQEIRRPVSSIMGYTDILMSDSAGDDKDVQHHYLERVKDSTKRVAGLLDDLINATTGINLAMNLHPTAADLNMVINDVIESVKSSLGERNITLRVDSANKLPHLYVDHNALVQLIVNLLKNVSAVTAAGGELWLRTNVEGSEKALGYVIMQVTNSGAELPAETLAHGLSTPSSSDDLSTSELRNDSADIAVVEKLVEANGGRFWVQNLISSETTYSVLLPLPSGNHVAARTSRPDYDRPHP